jgi:hypothetical protein
MIRRGVRTGEGSWSREGWRGGTIILTYYSGPWGVRGNRSFLTPLTFSTLGSRNSPDAVYSSSHMPLALVSLERAYHILYLVH